MSAAFRIFGYLTDPLLQVTLLLLVALLFPAKYAKRPVLAAFAVAFVVFISPLPTYLLRRLETGFVPKNAGPRDAVVVLTGGIARYIADEQQYFWGRQPARAIEGVRLLKSSGSKYLVVTGQTPKSKDPWSETATVHKFAGEWDIPEDRIILEESAQNTYENAQNLKPILEKYGIHNFYLVTSGFHMRRAADVFKAAGYDFVPYPVSRIGTVGGVRWFSLTDGLIYWSAVTHEYAGLLAYKLEHRF